MRIYICIHTSIHIIYTYTSLHLYIYTSIHIYIYTYIQIYIYTYLHIYIHIHMYAYTNRCTHMQVYTYGMYQSMCTSQLTDN